MNRKFSYQKAVEDGLLCHGMPAAKTLVAAVRQFSRRASDCCYRGDCLHGAALAWTQLYDLSGPRAWKWDDQSMSFEGYRQDDIFGAALKWACKQLDVLGHSEKCPPWMWAAASMLQIKRITEHSDDCPECAAILRERDEHQA